MRKISTRVADISYDKEKRLVFVKIKENAEIELADTVENAKATKSLTGNDRYLVMIDAISNLSVSKEARSYSAQKSERDLRVAEAYIVGSTANKIVGNFYIKFNKPNVPTKLFSNPESALEWLEHYYYLIETKSNRQELAF